MKVQQPWIHKIACATVQGHHKNMKAHEDRIHNNKNGKKTVADKEPSDPPKAKKHKSIDSDEDGEEPQNEPGTSSNTQPTVPVLPCNSGDEDWRNLHTAWMMPPDAGAISFTKHCVVMAWFSTRADLCCCVFYSVQSRERTKTKEPYTVERYRQHLKQTARADRSRWCIWENAGFLLQEVQIQENPWQDLLHLFVDNLFGEGGTEMEQRVLARLRIDFQVDSEDWNDVTFTGQRIRWTKN